MEILGIFDVPMWALLSILASMLFYLYATWNHSIWSSLGIPGPKPVPLFGNSLEINQKQTHYVFGDWQKQFGRVYGMYQGVRPTLVVTDLNLLKEVMVKNFSNFSDRHFIKGLRPPLLDKALFFAKGSSWKRIRNLMTPTFSTSKLKLMSHYINRCSKLLVTCIEQKVQKGQTVDVKEVFGNFTMDVIAGTAFGLETNSQTEEEEPIVYHCRKMFETFSKPANTNRITLMMSFPKLAPLARYLGISAFRGEHARFLFKAIDDIIESRKADSTRDQRRADLLQMMVDSEADAGAITDPSNNNNSTKSHKRLTKEEIIGQGFIVLIAGFETTATTLQYLTYNLTLNQDQQDKVYEELQQKLGDEEPSYENISSLPLLEAAITETLRMFPPVPSINREAAETVTIGGYTIPSGCGVTIPIRQILHDPEYFPEPDKFKPERFMAENKANVSTLAAELAFGYGPRQCIGMRLALIEIKFAAARILRHFRFVKCDETPETVRMKGQVLAVPNQAIKVTAQIRQ